MSIKLDLTANFVPGEKIIRIRRVDRQNKPTSMGVIEYSIYASEAAKQADCQIQSGSHDVPDASRLSGNDVLVCAYSVLKQDIFPEGVDC